MKELHLERRVLILTLIAGLPGSAAALALLWHGPYSPPTRWTFTVLICGVWLGFTAAVRNNIAFPLQTLSNLLAAIREGDYSIRGRGATAPDALGEVMREVNALGETLREQRLGAVEATALLRKVAEEIDVAVFTFDGEHRLRLVNRAGERLLALTSEVMLGRTAEELGLGDCMGGEPERTVEINLPGGKGRWDMRRTIFREGGLQHQLLVLTDLSRALREEERQAWQRLIRVIGHELNNSLAPIQSVAESIESMLLRLPAPQQWPAEASSDMCSGLSVIRARAEALGRFMNAYARLARLPAPVPGPVDVARWIARTVSLEQRINVQVMPGPRLEITADGDQLDQLLINLVRNATDAALETGGGVRVSWSRQDGFLDVFVDDDGPGLSNTTNLFVPFFTTKPGGSGIGLVLSRQIAEGHGGSLTLENRRESRGCRARLRLPLEMHA
jgi:two-component system, NtrC family, nitrogen regulation sensor histidine kinase NtrY